MNDALEAIGNADIIFDAIVAARRRQASDVHVEPGEGIAMRIFTSVERLPRSAVGQGAIEAFLEITFDRLAKVRLEKIGMSDATYDHLRAGAIRIHASRGRTGPRLAIRLLARSIPDLESLRLPEVVYRFTEWRSGLVLVCGPTGSGKSTTIASILDRINTTSAQHIVTFEDPVEYVHRWSRSIITQYEVGRDVASFAEGVRGSLRADPDVLFIGELRTVETVAACLQAAESGHLVFAALHTPPETPQAVNRLIGLFPSEEQDRARARLSEALRAAVGLRLLPLIDGSGLRAATEILIGTDAVRRLIRDGSIHQLRSTIASSRKDGMQTLESHLTELVEQGEIDVVAARAASHYPDDIREPMGYRRR